MGRRRMAALGRRVAPAARRRPAAGRTRPQPAPPPPVTGELTGVCPDPVVVQTDWFPEAEYGAYFQLLGERPTFDTAAKRVRAPLIDRRPAGRGRPGDPLRRAGHRLPAGQRPALRRPGDHPGAGRHRRGDPELGRAAHPGRARAAGAQPGHADVGPGPPPGRAHRSPTSGRAGVPVLYYQTDTYMQYLLGAGPAPPGAGGRQLRRQPVALGGRRRGRWPRPGSPPRSPTSTAPSSARAAATTSTCS